MSAGFLQQLFANSNPQSFSQVTAGGSLAINNTTGNVINTTTTSSAGTIFTTFSPISSSAGSMPPPPPLARHRRKAATPFAVGKKDDQWDRTLDLLGVESIIPQDRPIPAIPPADSDSESEDEASDEGPSGDGKRKKKLGLVDLPIEMQKKVFEYASASDLIALSLVSKQFRNVAAEHLYRTFHVIFPDDEEHSKGVPIDGLARGLDTFVTSEFDYASYLREIILESESSGTKGEFAYRDYHFDSSCGKFLSTLLLMTIRRARALETFKWDIRVELDRQVLKALHQTKSLHHLHLRMHSGTSVPQSSPVVPLSGPPPPPPPGQQPFSNPPPPMQVVSMPPHPMPPGFGPPGIVPMQNSVNYPFVNKAFAKSQKSVRSNLPRFRPPPTISGFKNLKTLAVLDMDTYEYVNELKLCLKTSTTSLRSLQLSFSEALANKARKPPPAEIQSDDESELDDDGFGQPAMGGPPPPPNALSANDQAKTVKADEEKKKQESILGKIFGIESPSIPKPRPLPPAKAAKEPKSTEDPKKRFIKALAPAALRLMSITKPGSENTAENKETLEIIKKAVKQYLDEDEKLEDKVNGIASASKTPDASSIASVGEPATEEFVMSGANNEPTEPDTPGLFDKPETKVEVVKKEPGVANPDDIDIEEPEGKELDIETEVPVEDAVESVVEIGKKPGKPETESSAENDDDVKWVNNVQSLFQQQSIESTTAQVRKKGEEVVALAEAAKQAIQSGEMTSIDHPAHIKFVKAKEEFFEAAEKIKDISRQLEEIEIIKGMNTESVDSSPVKQTSEMTDYIRDTRGLCLQDLAIYLIPVRASVLSKSINLQVLESITLLNVGPQLPLWNMLGRENKFKALNLRRLHTDNVTLPFVVFVSQLKKLEELYLLERAPKPRVESSAAKTTVTIEHIRQTILKKHSNTLKVLVLRNESTQDWDLDIKTILLLCSRASKLEELAASFGGRSMHTLLQHIHGLTSLRALHTIHFRTNDSCLWVMVEYRKFFADTLCHYPAMKLEYVAVDQSVDRLVRRKPVASKKKDRKGKGKETVFSIESTALGPNSNFGVEIANGVGSNGLPAEFQDSSDDDDDDISSLVNGLRIETVEGLRFTDIPRVKMFTKEVTFGRL